MRWILIVMAVAMFAGCMDNTEPSDGSASPEPVEPATTPAEPAEPTADAPPTASLTSKSSNVTIPTNVTLLLDGQDPEGQVLQWTLARNGTDIESGEGLPTEIDVLIDAAGNHTFTLTVSDGNHTVEAGLTLVAIAPPEIGPDAVHLELDIAMSCFHCYITQVGPAPDNCVGLRAGTNNEDCAWVEIDDAWRGRAFVTSGPTDIDVAWYTTCEAGNEIETIGDAGHDAGIIHDSAGCMVMWDWETRPEAAIITLDIV